MKRRGAIKKLLESGVVKSGSVDEHLKLLNGISRKYSKARLDKEVKILKSLSDPARLKIIKALTEREMCVCELEYIFEQSQPTISYHLKFLESANILKRRKQGKWSLYSIANGRVTRLLKDVDLIL
ncbi:MAG: metalloregulator ArsR/SmtB family transcription factor [Thermoproteota archaeon]